MIAPDKTLKTIAFSQKLLRNLNRKKQAEISINRHYIDDETVKVNFHFLGKRYLLVLHHGDILHAEIWHSHNKGKYLVKEHYTAKDIGRGNFIKD